MKKIAFVYTSMGGLAAAVQKLCGEMLPGAKTVHLADSGLVGDVIRENGVTPQLRMRLMKQFEAAAAAGADAIVCCCSTVGETAEQADAFFEIPIIRIDQAMIDEAVCGYSRIGVLASLNTTIGPTVGCIKRTAARLGCEVSVLAQTAEGAYQAQAGGDTETHDRLLRAAALAMRDRIDVLLLAQGSMARMEQPLQKLLDKPVLSSPARCIRALNKWTEGCEDVV